MDWQQQLRKLRALTRVLVGKRFQIAIAGVALVLLVLLFKEQLVHIVVTATDTSDAYLEGMGHIVTAGPGKEICTTGNYEFEYSAEVHRGQGPRFWPEVQRLPCIYLNLGGDTGRHPARFYKNYVTVQGTPESEGWGCAKNGSGYNCGDWCVCHDLKQGIPLQESSVDRVHSEECLEHLPQAVYPFLLKDIHRILKPGGRARLAMPDFNHPDLVWQLRLGHGDGIHLTMTNYALLKMYVDKSPFRHAEWLMYWDNDAAQTQGEVVSNVFLPPGAKVNSRDRPMELYWRKMNYSLGKVKRTPIVDRRNKAWDPHHVTSLIVDLVKESA